MNDNSNDAPPWVNAWLVAAYKIASQAHEPDAAWRAVFAAANRINATTNTSIQTVKDRERNNRKATVPVLFGPPMLQRLLYSASDSIACEEEQDEDSRPEKQLLFRYLQFLIHHCLHRQSRWHAVAIAQLVYSYKGTMVDKLVSHFVDEAWDPRGRKRDKEKLIKVLQERFPSLIPATAADGKAEHFEPFKNQEPFADILSDWLRLLTPWTTEHLLTPGFNLDSLPPELLDARDPDWRELCRIHVFVCPECFERLVVKLGYPEPATMMRLPKIGRGSPHVS